MMSQLLMSVLAQRKQAIGPVLITATFDSNGGSPTYSSQSGYDSLNVTNPGTPTRSGYTFTGWSPSLPRTITTSTTFTAQWQQDPENVVATFDSNGGTPDYGNELVPVGGTVNSPGSPTRDGYTFTGWSPSLPRTITSNTTFTAQWQQDPDPDSENYVRFVSAEARTITPKYTNSGITLQYSIDNGASWTTIASGSATLNATTHLFRGQATGTKSLFTTNVDTNKWAFSGSSNLEVYGNLNSLLCDTLGDEVAPTSLGDYAYSNMFRDCTSLTVAPELPATTLAERCYTNMFRDCTSLTTAPALPATTLATYCYTSMFEGCTSLTLAPELPATKLEGNCYLQMFKDCTSFKVSATNTGAYTYAWRIPTSGTATTATSWNFNMLTNTGGTFTSNPNINTTYYVQNEPV